MALPFLASDLCELLDDLTLVRRQTVLFALASGMDLREATDLRWKFADALTGLDPLAQGILDARPEHPRLDYVFWEELENGLIAPVLGLHDSLWESSSGMTFKQLAACYRRMVWIHPGAEVAAFRRDLGDALQAL